MGTPLLGGREFTEHDDTLGQRVLIVNQAFASRFWPGEDALGREVVMKADDSPQRVSYRIVGVVKTGKYRTLAERPRAMIFRSVLQHYSPTTTLVVQSSIGAGATVAAVRAEVARIQPNLALAHAGTLDDHLALALFPSRATGIVLGVTGLIGLSLAIAGLIAVVAYTVARRTREIGIRMALGAQRNDIVNHVVSDAVRQVAIGGVLGSAAALVATRLLSGVLVGISATDPLTFAATIAGLLVVALSACLVTARRATRIDPMIAIRTD
jgi:ABC-type antimicrobial peptide transport system permease subunit